MWAKIVVSSDIQQDTDQAAHKLAAEGYDARGVRCDILKHDDIAPFSNGAIRAYGRADILFCLAAAPAPIGRIVEIAPSSFDEMLISTISNNLALIRQFLPGMVERRNGSIVVMSSIASIRANPILGGYGASKAALNGLVRSLAVECGSSNIRVNALAPSIVRTAFSKDLWSDPAREKAIREKIPAKRIAEVEDIVGAAILLASPAGSYISGQVLRIDGARSVI